MPKDAVVPNRRGMIFQENSLLHEAQLAFLEEIDLRGGSLIATSFAYQVTSAELARRACLLGLLSYWQATDYDAGPASNRNLPSYIALEDCLVALTERHPGFLMDEDLLTLKIGIAKMKRDENWTRESLQAFLRSGETLFASCRDEEGLTSAFASIGLDALVRMSARIMSDNGALRHDLQDIADAQIELYFDHLSEAHLTEGSFDIMAIARGENRSPAWISGKLLAAGLIPLHHTTLDPVLDPGTRSLAAREMDASALSIANQYAAALGRIWRQDRRLDPTSRHAMRLRLAAAEAGLRQLTELNADPLVVMNIMDHLDLAAREAGSYANSTVALSFAGHSRLHLQTLDAARLAENSSRP